MNMFRTLALNLSLLIACSWAAQAEATCTGSGLAWSCTAGSTVAQVQATVNSAPSGAIISFAAGSYSWSSAITLSNTKGVTFQGAGIDQSVVTVGGTIITLDTLSGNNTNTYRITGFTFQNAPAQAIIWFWGSGTMNSLRIDHNKFSNFNVSSIAILFGEMTHTTKIFGVMDHNIFTGSSNYITFKYLGPGNPTLWASSLRGSAQAYYVEDNTYAFTTAGNLSAGCIDVWRAGAVVFRHNSVANCLVTAHGVVHNTTVLLEVYSNTLTRTAGSGGVWEDGTRLIHHQGSGEMFFFNNTFGHTGTISSSAMSVTHYRSADPTVAGYSDPPGRCAGSKPIDGNWAPTGTYYGYPCWMQPGRAPNGGTNAFGSLSPIYAWMNVDQSNGGKVPVTIENPWGATSPAVSDHIKPNRDFYDAVSAAAQTSASSPFNGTTGMGFGPLALRPTTCTTNASESGGGVGYWATDTNTLYRCSATNTWVTHYQPYTYPHPLQAGVGPPQNLRVN